MLFRFLILVFMAGISVASAQQNPGLMTVTGQGQVLVTPDMATISLGVEVSAPTADRALRSMAVRMRLIIDVLQNSGIADKDIQTSQLSLHPQRTNRSSNQPLKITGFLASNQLEVRVRNLDALGITLDVLTKSGANRIQNIRLDIAVPGPHLDEARKRAMADALRKAALYAKAAQVKLGPIVSIAEAGNANPPQFRAQALSLDTLPIAEGELTLSTEVIIQFAIGP